MKIKFYEVFKLDFLVINDNAKIIQNTIIERKNRNKLVF